MQTTSSSSTPASFAAQNIEDKEELYLQQREQVLYEGERIFSLGNLFFQKEQKVEKLIGKAGLLCPSTQSSSKSHHPLSKIELRRILPPYN